MDRLELSLANVGHFCEMLDNGLANFSKNIVHLGKIMVLKHLFYKFLPQLMPNV